MPWIAFSFGDMHQPAQRASDMPTPIKRVFRKFRFIFEREPWVFEVIFGAATAMFFFLAWADWRDGPTFGSLRVLSEVQPEDFWHWAGLLGGITQCVAAMIDGHHRTASVLKWLRWVSAGVLAALWGSMTGGAWIAAPWTPTAIIYAACAVANMYVALHILWEDEYRLVRRPGA